MGKLSYDRGTTYSIGVTYTNSSGIPGATAMFTVKSVPNDSDAADTTNAILRKDVAMVANAASIVINPPDVPDTVAPGKYYYDVKVLDASGEIFLIDSGPFTLIATPTNRLS